jgi:hypothetical protein
MAVARQCLGLEEEGGGGALRGWGQGGGVLRGQGRDNRVLQGQDRGWQATAAPTAGSSGTTVSRATEERELLVVLKNAKCGERERERAGPKILWRET